MQPNLNSNPQVSYPDAYVVHLHDPNYPKTPPRLAVGSDAFFSLQKYHYSKSKRRYRPVFRREVALHLHIDSYEPSTQKNQQLPILIEAHPRYPLPSRLAMPNLYDPIVSSLMPEFRILLRYDPEQNIGCLVHVGLSFAGIDDNPCNALWMSADRIEQDRLQAENPPPHTS